MSDFKKFSYDEFLRGFAATTVLSFIFGWKYLLLSLATGLLWMAGGTYNKVIRRYGVPLAILLFQFGLIQLVCNALGCAILHIGDGFPDHREATKDEGSALGRWVEKHIDSRDYVGGEITKWLIPIIFQISIIPYLWLI